MTAKAATAADPAAAAATVGGANLFAQFEQDPDILF